ncbi:MAG: bis(5'-nucleosyl)-tetraphosphatase (symmetrical) YqeK [Oscillospiraceae bacterium]|nr:bis(5'-nucleosyl)-tetraphosphatase (symmetrical) YqeK [Oscillospiraceae bacterium]
MESIKKYTRLVKDRLSEERFTHSVKSAEMSRELGVAHGFDSEKAYIAGILHDICKEDSEKELKRLAFSKTLEKMGLGLEPLEKEDHKLWHAPAATVYIKEVLGINDTDILSAVRYHTVGRARMTKLEKIIYLGDLVEHSREYPDVDKYRDFALSDLDLGMYEALKWAINDCLQRKKRISRNTFEAYNHYLKKFL